MITFVVLTAIAFIIVSGICCFILSSQISEEERQREYEAEHRAMLMRVAEEVKNACVQEQKHDWELQYYRRIAELDLSAIVDRVMGEQK